MYGRISSSGMFFNCFNARKRGLGDVDIWPIGFESALKGFFRTAQV